jgi:subtilisin family serine protease
LIHLEAPGATVISINVASPLGLADETKLAKGIDRAVAEEADIINLSLGGYPFVANREWPAFPAFGLLKQKIDELPSKTAIVAAAGNSGSSAPFYPAAFHDQVIGVAALDAKGSLWARSNYGDWVRACARGAGLRSLFVKGEEDPDFLPDAETPDVFGNDLNYAAWSGTSFAAPLVAAQIAIVAREFGIDDKREAAEHLLAMSLEPYGTLPCGKRVLVNVPGQT